MDWQFIVALAIVIPIILIPALLIWYLNIGGAYAAARDRVRIRGLATFVRALRTFVAIIVPVGVYGSLIWFFLGRFGWQVALAVALVLPIILFVPVLIWIAVVSGLYQVALDSLRRWVMASRRRVVRVAE